MVHVGAGQAQRTCVVHDEQVARALALRAGPVPDRLDDNQVGRRVLGLRDAFALLRGKVARNPARPPRGLRHRGGAGEEAQRAAVPGGRDVFRLAQLSRQTMSSLILSPCTGRKCSRSSTRPCRQSSTLLSCSQPSPRHTSTGVTNPCRSRASAAATATLDFRLLLLTRVSLAQRARPGGRIVSVPAEKRQKSGTVMASIVPSSCDVRHAAGKPLTPPPWLLCQAERGAVR
jgi:hypothetical protein